MGWKLVCSVLLGALLLGLASSEVWSAQATLPEEYLAKPKEKPSKPKAKLKAKSETPKEQNPPPSDAAANSSAAIQSDSRFTMDEQRVIHDRQTGLQWYVRINIPLDWDSAQSWAQGLSVGGGGWRMPTMAEFRSLKGTGSVQGVCDGTHIVAFGIDPLFSAGCWFVWSSDMADSMSARFMNFNTGAEEQFYRVYPNRFRVFAVRSK